MLISLTIGVTGFLCILNAGFAVAFRKRLKREFLSYLAACLLELTIFGVVLAIRLSIVTSIPYHLPLGFPLTRTAIGAALAVGVGLLPAAFWHRTSASKLRARIAQDARANAQGNSSVRMRSTRPGDWMN